MTIKNLSIQEMTRLSELMEGDRGINPAHIYCIQTGHPMGRVDIAERILAVDMIRANSEEELMDDLEIRTLLSMRPSIVWNSLDSRSIHRLRMLAPRQLLSYLLIRCYEPRDPNGHLNMPMSQRLDMYRGRIQMYRLVEFMPIGKEKLNELLLALLSIDSMFNLNAVAVDTGFPAPATITSDEAATHYISELWKWFDWLYAKKSKAERQAKLSSEYWGNRGNSVTRDATIKLTIESKPRAEATVKKLAKKAADNDMVTLLKGIMEAAEKGEAPVTQEMKPAAKPTGFIPAGGLRLNLAGKK
jgi:hypothetical protein